MRKIIFILFAMFLLVFSYGCKTQSTSNENIPTQNLKISDDLKQLLNPPEIPENTTSFDKIDSAYQNNKITLEQSMELKIIAGYSPELLPKEFKGQDSGRSDLQEAKIWLTENFDSLDENTKQALEPYYVLPNDPKSYLNNNVNENTKSFIEEISAIPSVQGAAPWDVKAVEIDDLRNANIYYHSSNTKEVAMTVWVDEAFKKAHPMFETFFGLRPRNRIYIYLMPMNDRGTAEMRDADNENRCVIELDTDGDMKTTKSSIAHELFHCFQYAIPLKYDTTDRKWMMEATATWAENFVYPDYNIEQGYLPKFFKYLNKNMISYGNSRQYSTYAWFLFLSQTADPMMIRKMLSDAKNTEAKQVVTGMDNFDYMFSQFSLWNWNQDPEKMYIDNPDFPGSPLGGLAYTKKLYSSKQENNEQSRMEKLGMSYHVSVFNNNIDKVVFKFQDEGDSQHQRQVLVKIGGVWHTEDWTHLTERKFCRNRDSEKIEAVVLITSNSDPDNDYTLPFIVDTKDKCNPTWHGTTKITWNEEKNSGHPGLIASGGYTNNKILIRGTIVITDELEYDDQRNEMVIKNTFATINAYNLVRSDISGKPCGMMWSYEEEKVSGSTYVDYTGDYPVPRWYEIFPENSNIADNISFDPSVQGKNEWIKQFFVDKSFTKSCDIGIGYVAPDKLYYDTVLVTDSSTGVIRSGSADPFEIDGMPVNNKLRGTYIQNITSDSDISGTGIFANYLIKIEYNYEKS